MIVETSSEFTKEEEEYENEQLLLYSKVGFIFFIFAATMISSYLPWIIHRRFSSATSSKIISIGCCFTAGIIIGAGFSHLLPDAIGTWEEYFLEESNGFTYKGYPWASLLSIFTMFVLLWIDKVFVDKGVEGEGEHNHNHMVIDLEPMDKDERKHNHHYHHHEDAAGEDEEGEVRVNVGEEGNDHTPVSLSASDENFYNNGGDVETASPKDHHEDTKNLVSKNKSKKAYNKLTEVTLESNPDPLPSPDAAMSSRKALSRAMIFFVALSMHSLFDGLGMGAEDDVQEFFGLLIAVAGHKLLDGFALGVPLYFAKLPTYQVLGAVVFCAAMTPIGIAIGMAATAGFNGSSSLLAKAIILSISSGSFFFISLLELLPSGLVQGGRMEVKLSAAMFGWFIMALIAIWV